MEPETLIQKLFALERAVGTVSNATLRCMILDAEEAALAIDRELLTCLRAEQAGLPAMTNASLARDLGTRSRSQDGTEPGSSMPDELFSIAFSPPHRKSA